MLTTATKNKINTARDILVGKIPMPTSQVEQITLALVYKFMSDMDKKGKELGDTSGFFANGYEKYSWDKLMDKSLPARDRVKLYGEGLEKMALNPHIPQLFRDIFRNAFLPFNDPETLKLFLDTIDQFEYDHSEELGNAFEYLLQVMGSQGDAGQFRTPRHIIDFIVEVVEPTKTDKVLDPACGTAGFLISAYKHILNKGLSNDEMKTISQNFVGYDISQDMQRLSLVNLYLHHFPDPHIYEYDTLTSEDRWNDDFDVILANPPFMTPKGGIRPHNRFSVPSNRAEVLFVDYIMEHLTVNGRAGVIVPEGIIFQSQNAYKNLRKMMVDNDYLWAVVSLPSGIFQPYSGVKTSILLFDRQLAKTKNEILYCEVRNTGISLGATNAPISENDLPDVLKDLLTFKNDKNKIEDYKSSWVVAKQVIRKAKYNLGIATKKSNKFVENGFSLYKLSEISTLSKGKSSSTKTAPGQHPLVLTAGERKSSDHFDFEGYGVAVPLISALGHGKAEVKRIHLVEGKFALANLLAFVQPDKNKVLPKYLYYVLNGNKLGLANLMKGAANVSMKISDLEGFEIPVPSLTLQQTIIEELDSYQKIIDGAKQVVDNYKPSFKIENDWLWKPLSDFCDIQGGYAFKSDDFVSDGIQLIRMGNVKQDFFDQTNKQVFLPKNYFEKYTNYALTQGDIIISMTGTVGKDDYANVCRIDTKGNYLLNQRVSKLVIDIDKVDPDYFYLCAISPFFKKQVIANNSGGVRQANVSATGIAKATIPLPTLDVQKKIAAALNIERKVVSQNKILISAFEAKIKSRIDEMWGK